MKVQCALCGAELERANPTKHCFCCAEHRNEWMRQNVDFAALSRGHKAKHLTKLNAERNPHCRVSERGRSIPRRPGRKRRHTSDGPSSPEKSSIT